ncbi:MAG: PAS domain S-box protein, partial [Peptococcaceae bacterium]|nr:PAS domain S-box protein [Peptococcaceae bacterium]
MNLNFYQQLIQNLPIPYAYHHIICNSEGKPCDYEFIEINSAYENFTGLTKKEIIGRRATQIFSAMGNKGLDWIECFGGLALNGGQKEFEHYAEEQKKWYKIIAYSPQKFYFTTFFIDISAEKKQAARQFNINDKQTEKPNHFSWRQLSDIIEFLPDATLAIDVNKRVIIWNKAIEKMTGIPASEMIGKGDYAYSVPFYGAPRPQLMNLVFGEELSEADACRYKSLTREGDTIEAEVYCPALYNNKGAWVYTKVSPLHDQEGKIIGAIESIRDITERKLFEESLREKTAFLEAQINSSFDGIVLDDANFRRIYTNSKYYEIFNVPQHIIDS